MSANKTPFEAPSKTSHSHTSHQTPPSKDQEDQAPAYTDSTTPPPYTAEAAANYLLALREGDPDEKIDVPFVHSVDSKSFKDYLLFRNVGTVSRRIVPRSMTRRRYNEWYAHDAEGNFIGTGKRAPDAGLVFIPGKGTEAELLEQVRRVAHEKKNHDPNDFPIMGGTVGGGWGGGGGM